MSHVDDICEAMRVRFADATVSFEVGENQKNRHGQLRRIIFTRTDGIVRKSSAPGRNVATHGLPGSLQRMVFQRRERTEIELRAESDTALDIMFDRLLKCIDNEFGSNALADENPYHWGGKDSTTGGANTSRQPSIVFDLWLNMRSRDAFPLPLVDLTALQATVTELSNSVVISTP